MTRELSGQARHVCPPPEELVPDDLLAVVVAELDVADHEHPVQHHR